MAPGSLAPVRNLDRSLGDGGMPLLGQLGLSFERYGEGWAEATWTPTELACNPFGIVHGGVYGVIHDAAMNFATNSALESGDRVATLDVSYQTRRAPKVGDQLAVRGEVVQLTRQVAVRRVDGHRRRRRRSSRRRMATFIVRRTAQGDRARDRLVTTTDAPGPLTRRIRRGWILEVLVGVGIYLLYDWLREQATGTERRRVPQRASRSSTPRSSSASTTSTRSSRRSCSARLVHVVLEHLLRHHPLRVPVVALVWLYRKAPARYVRWRNTLVFMLGIVARSGSGLYPLMPPRLMPGGYGFVDTAAEFFNFGPQVRVRLGRRTASRRRPPSARTATSSPPCRACTWVGRRGRRSRCGRCCAARGRRCCWALYPVSILFCIVVTANHWILDAVGGWIVLGLGYLCAIGFGWLLATRRAAKATRTTATVPAT